MTENEELLDTVPRYWRISSLLLGSLVNLLRFSVEAAFWLLPPNLSGLCPAQAGEFSVLCCDWLQQENIFHAHCVYCIGTGS
jgi:hypothetical protein